MKDSKLSELGFYSDYQEGYVMGEETLEIIELAAADLESLKEELDQILQVIDQVEFRLDFEQESMLLQ